MGLHLVKELCAKLCFCAPLLYIGMVMLTDPAGFARLPAVLAQAIRNFEQALRGSASPGASPAQPQSVLSGTARNALRLAGLALILSAVLVFVTGN